MQIFLAVAEEGGFTRAGEALHVSQPSVSQAIAELEGELGTRLFERLGRTVALTAAGEALLGPARQALREVARGAAAVRAVVGLSAGRLDLCALPTLAVDPLAPLVGRFHRAYPGVAIALSAPEDTGSLVEMLRTGRTELAITERLSEPGLVMHPLSDQDLLVVLPPGSDRASPVALAELGGTPFVASPPGTSTRRLLDEAFAQVGLVPNVAVVTAQREAWLPLLLAGAGAGLLPRPLAEVAVRLGCVAVEPVPGIGRTVALVQRDGPLTPAAAAFVGMALASPGHVRS